MKNLADRYRNSSRFSLTVALLIVTLLGAIIYFAAVPTDPPGFYIDESSIAYNAYLISRTGADEHGESWPLYFAAFGDYKNPTYIYLLAGIFRIAGPGISAARHLSAAFGLLTGIFLAVLAWQITRKASVVIIVGVSALLTPWLYESSRLVFEVALYPLLTVLFLIALWRASQKQSWQFGDIVGLAVTLSLLTYSYSIGRLLAPLLAAGLALFIRRHGWRSVIKVWLSYVVTLIPLILFYRHHPGALSNRFALLTYITPNSKVQNIAIEFARHFLANLNPWHWLITGEDNVRDHLNGFGSLLAVTVVLAIPGVILIWRKYRREPWWQFILYGLMVSVIPASLTRNEFPQLRLIAFPVFFHLLALPTLAWLAKSGTSEAAVSDRDKPTEDKHSQRRLSKRGALLAALSLIVIQGTYFQRQFHKKANDRWYVFDARFPRKVMAVALETGKNPIYLSDPPGNSGYIQAYWYAVLRGFDTSRFVHLPTNVLPPAGSLVISTAEDCENCKLLAKSINYTVYAVLPSTLNTKTEALSPHGFRANIHAENLPAKLKAGTKTLVSVLVKNVSTAEWPCVGEYAVGLRNRWLRSDGSVINDSDGHSRFPYDLEPGDTAGVHIEITAPQSPGEYLLELDVVQAQIAWFGDKGSERLTWRLVVEP
ncbi:MAG TPA: hypothetical protein DC047_10050 [Blastocatellia bacterium]|nr:hypothetical protein [Blastocatellia bacterium]